MPWRDAVLQCEVPVDAGAFGPGKLGKRDILLADAADVWAKDLGETITDSSVVAELARRMKVAPSELRPAVLAAALSAAVVTGWNVWVRSSGEEDPGELVAASIDLLGLTG